MKKKIVSCLLVAVMCTLIGSVAYADESESVGRAGSIKSHGTLLCEQADADDEVYITSQDLINLANDVDRLEDLIDGLQCKDNPNIEYTYHYHHKGDESASSNTIYSYDNPGGCYRGAGHTHDKTGTCSSYEYQSKCNWIHTAPDENPDGSECPYHGITYTYAYDEFNGTKWLHTYKCSYKRDVKEYTCGSPTNTWTVQCGWREGEIEAAYIAFEAH